MAEPWWQRRAVQTFRVARPASTGHTVKKTSVQIVVVWGLVLGVLPATLVKIERMVGLRRFRLRGQVPIGVGMFVLGGSLGLTSAWFMASEGRGTPIPFDAASELVIVGPYRVIRNPMAVSAIAQSAGVALAAGSPFAGAVPVAGAIVWNQLIRPTEEIFLADRFGDAYRDYQRRVRCWVPTWPPYQPPA